MVMVFLDLCARRFVSAGKCSRGTSPLVDCFAHSGTSPLVDSPPAIHRPPQSIINPLVDGGLFRPQCMQRFAARGAGHPVRPAEVEVACPAARELRMCPVRGCRLGRRREVVDGVCKEGQIHVGQISTEWVLQKGQAGSSEESTAATISKCRSAQWCDQTSTSGR